MKEIEKLSWDSQLFGFNVGILHELPSNKNLLENINNFRLIYFFIQPEDIKSQHNANLLGAKLVDTKVIYDQIIHVDDSTNYSTDDVIEYNDKIVTPSLYHLALLSGGFSRFKKDTKLPKGSFEKLYSIWIERSVSREIAKKIFVIKHDNNIIAFATLDIVNNIAKIGLFAVDELYHGKGLGKKLMNQIKHFCKLANIEILEVPTQLENVIANKFYEANGFLLKNKIHVYHYWND